MIIHLDKLQENLSQAAHAEFKETTKHHFHHIQRSLSALRSMIYRTFHINGRTARVKKEKEATARVHQVTP